MARWIGSVTGREKVHNQRGWEYLRRLEFTPHGPRRRHAAVSTEKLLEEQAAFKNKLPAATKALRGKNRDLEVWALDEHRMGLKAILRYVWAKRGERPTAGPGRGTSGARPEALSNRRPARQTFRSQSMPTASRSK